MMRKESLKLLLAVGLLFFYFPFAFAKKDFRPGYIISNNGDTVRGYLLYKAAKTSTVCSFKTGLKDKQTEYSPKDILAFRYNDGRYFIKKEVPLESGNKLVFVEFLIKGKANIYYMRDGTDHYFIEKEDGRIVELTESEKIISGQYGHTYIKPQQYTGKLKSVLSDCPEIYPEIDRVNLSHSSLIELARDYHAKVCTTEECIVFERIKKPFRLRFGFYAGYTLNTIKFGGRLTTENYSGYVVKYGNQLVSNYATGGLLGCRFEFENVFSSFEHASILVDVAVQRFSNYHLTEAGEFDFITYNGAEYKLSQSNTYPYQTSLEVNLNTYMLKIPLLFNYTFLKGIVRPYVNAGILNMFVLSQNKEFNLLRFTEKFGKSIPTYHIGVIGSAGIKVVLKNNHYLFFDLGCEFTQTLNTWADWRFINNLFEIKMGFTF